MTPLSLFRRVAVAEAITWALLLIGMFLKYVTRTTDLGVSIFGMVHGVVFVAYGVVSVLVWVDQKWTTKQGVLALVSAIPPFMTLWFDRWIEKKGGLGTTWRLRAEDPVRPVEKLAAALVRRPGRGLLVGGGAVVVLTAAALLVGPPLG